MKTTLGFWERDGKNPALGAFIVTILIVAFYSLAGNIVVLIYMLGDMSSLGTLDWFEFKKDIIGRYRVPILTVTMLFEFLFFGAGTFLVFRFWHKAPLRERFRIGLPKPIAIFFALIGAIGLFPFALFAGGLFERAFPFLKELEEPGSSLLSAASRGEWTLLVAAICVTPALWEEFLFRGYLQSNLGRKVRSPWSWIIAGSLFALIHQNYFGLGALLTIGIYLAFVFDASDSIWTGVLVHFCYNGAVVLLANEKIPILLRVFNEEGNARGDVVLMALPLAALGIIALTLIKRNRLRSAENPT